MDELLKLLQANALESRENLAKLLDLPLPEVNKRIEEYEAPDPVTTDRRFDWG